MKRLENKVAVITAAGQGTNKSFYYVKLWLNRFSSILLLPSFKTNMVLGIGKATALRFAEEGCQVFATDINQDALKTLENVPGICNSVFLFHSSIDIIWFSGITTRVLDVTKNDAILELAKELDKIDVLFNCAGYGSIDILSSIKNM